MFTTRPELRGTFGMVSSTHWLASATGMAVLETGGSAFDAACAAGFTLQVVEPHLNGPGGEVPILVYDSARGATRVICGQGPAPATATIEAFADRGLDLVPGTGTLAACVPGAFGAWMRLLADHGTRSVPDVLGYAVSYARDGYPLVPRIVSAVASVAEVFRERWPSSADVYLRAPLRAGHLFANPDLARTYQEIADAAARVPSRDKGIEIALDIFYRGRVAEAVHEHCVGTGALLRGDDLAVWEATVEAPVTLGFRSLEVHKPPAWSQGPVFLQQLMLLEALGVLDRSHISTAEHIHAVIESAKLAFADREAYYGDPSFTDVPLDRLLSPGYAAQRAALVGEEASRELRPGGPDPRLPGPLTPRAIAAGAGEPTRGDTCHVCVVDAAGNMVAATPSGGWLQSSPVIPGLGFPLGTRAQMFWLEPGLPNSLEPGKRPRTTLSPTLVTRDGIGYLAFGTPGGDQQDQWSLNFLLDHVVGGLDLQAAIDAPNFHTEHFPSSFYPRGSRPGHLAIESRAGDRVVHALEARGHDVEVTDPWSLGRVSAVGRDADGVLKAGANPRGMQGYAAGR